MQYYNWQTRTQFYPRELKNNTYKCIHTLTHTHTIQTDIFWMLIIRLLLHPTWKKRREEEKQKGRKCQRAKWQASRFHNNPLYRSICIHLTASTFPNESPYNSGSQRAVTYRLTEMINCHHRLYLSPRVLALISCDAVAGSRFGAIVGCPYHVYNLWSISQESPSPCFNFLSNHLPLVLLLIRYALFPPLTSTYCVFATRYSLYTLQCQI